MALESSKRRSRVIRLEASTLCQLRCPTCPTTEGLTHASLGAGFLTSANFLRLLNQFDEENIVIELSNYGEVLLSPYLIDILRIARERNCWVSCYSGANINTLRDATAEAIVKYKMLGILCSIDGASEDTYAMYRKRGSFTTVINNIKKINALKQHYDSSHPRLVWQFVVFGHNQHELPAARALARSLGMEFVEKSSWDPDISPLRAEKSLLDDGCLGGDSKAEHDFDPYSVCEQLWISPQINYDGRVLGCCANHWADFGGENAFDNYRGAITGERISYARSMLLGDLAERFDVPCIECDIYKERRRRNRWVDRAIISQAEDL